MAEQEAGAGPRDGGDYDAVVMLTWSDWATEPRSNRYHYATRFARRVPVLFLQPQLRAGDAIAARASEVAGLDLVDVPSVLDAQAVAAILALLRERGIRRPLLWVYSSYHYGELLRALPRAFRVYHATEDYLTASTQRAPADDARLAASVRELMPDIDLLVGVSDSVIRVYVERGGFAGPTVLAPNGCDAPFFEDLRQQHGAAPEPRTCIFQGGINRRLDGELMLQVVRALPDWQFWFCGAVEPGWQPWAALAAEPNVRHFGTLQPEEFGRLMCRASVGWIPYLQDALIWNSLPLKAYEYVACGLPVVTVPIAALMDQPALFTVARRADEFAAAIRAQAATRSEPGALAARANAARDNSYDARFATVLAAIARMIEARTRARRLNVAVLYDDGSVHVNTVREHLASFGRYSRHHVFYLPACYGEAPAFAMAAPAAGAASAQPDFSAFDVLVIHYSVRVSLPEGHMAEPVRQACAAFAGLKVLFIQDEYDEPQVTCRWMEQVGIDVVYTCVPGDSVPAVYDPARFPDTAFLPTLTGYVPENPAIDFFARPLRERPWLFGYRGRKLPPIYGSLGHEKYMIGAVARKLAAERGLAVDIEVDNDKRIYGDDWYRFLGSSRATLGTESGSNLFDFDGSAAALIERALGDDPSCDYPALAARLRPYEQAVRMNQVSPKIFEAIRTRTALVLFEGSYSGVVQPHLHYLPLKKDFSNFDEVVAALQDDALVTQLTQRAHADVIDSGKYSYRSFVAAFDAELEQRAHRTAAVQLSAVPLFAQARRQLLHMAPANAAALLLSTAIHDRAQRAAVEGLARAQGWLPAAGASTSAGRPNPARALAVKALRGLWRSLPPSARELVARAARKLAAGGLRNDVPTRALDRAVVAAWRLTPEGAKRVLLRVARGGQ